MKVDSANDASGEKQGKTERVHHMSYVQVLKEKKKEQEELLDESVQSRYGFWILRNPLFDYFITAIIMLNLAIVIIETDARASEGSEPARVEAISWCILLIFVLELALRLNVQRCEFWIDSHNIFDFLLVVVDASLNSIGVFFGGLFPVSFLRVIRLVKVARLTKVFHKLPELRLLLGGLASSMKAIFWGTVLLAFFILSFSIIAVQFIHPLTEDMDASDFAGCDRCVRAYRSVYHASMTIFATIVAGDSWGWYSVPIMEKHPATIFFFGFVFMSIGIALLNLFIGIVVDVATNARASLQQEMLEQKQIQLDESKCHLMKICEDMDLDGDGYISIDELQTGMQMNEHLREAMALLGLQEEELDMLWTILDTDKSGAISYGEFVRNMYTMKTSDTHFMLATIKYYTEKIKKGLDSKLDSVRDEVVAEEEKLMKAEEEKIMEIEHGVLTLVEEIAGDSNVNMIAAELGSATNSNISGHKSLEGLLTPLLSVLKTESAQLLKDIKEEVAQLCAETKEAKTIEVLPSTQCKEVKEQLRYKSAGKIAWPLVTSPRDVPMDEDYARMLLSLEQKHQLLLTEFSLVRQHLATPLMHAHLEAAMSNDLLSLPRQRGSNSSSVWPRCCNAQQRRVDVIVK